MNVQIVESMDRLAPYLDAWNGILRENGNTNPYLTPEWIAVWWEFFGKGRELHIIAVADGGNAVGFCPLMITRKPFFTKAEFIGTPQAWRMGFIARMGYEDAVVKCVLEHLKAMKGNVVVRLYGLNRQDACRDSLVKALDSRRLFMWTIPCYLIRLKSFACAGDFVKSRMRHHMVKKALSREKALAGLTDLKLAEARAEETETIFPMHEKRWQRKNDGNGFAKGLQREFFAFVAKTRDFHSFRAMTYFLKAGPAPIAFLFGLECNGRFTSTRIAHDDDFAVFHPGTVLKKRVLEEFFARQMDSIDYSVGDEQHKREWTDEYETYDRLEFSFGSLLAYALVLFHRLRHIVRMLMKRSTALVRLKRVTIGRIRYFLSGAPLRQFIGKAVNTARMQGWSGIPAMLFDSIAGMPVAGRTRSLVIRPSHTPRPGGSPLMLHTAGLDEVNRISELTNMDPANIVKRYCNGSRCQVLSGEGGPVGHAWICENDLRGKRRVLWRREAPGDRCIYGISICKGASDLTVSQALFCLARQPLPKSCHALHFLLPAWDRRLTCCAEALFRKVRRDSDETGVPEAGKVPDGADRGALLPRGAP